MKQKFLLLISLFIFSAYTDAYSVMQDADLDFSTITADPDTVYADGNSTSTITVQLKNMYEGIVTTSGGVVTLNTTGGTLSAVTDNGDGTYVATLQSSAIVETAVITGQLDGLDFTKFAEVTFITPPIPVRDITFTVDMSAVPYFDSDFQTIHVSGSFNDWSADVENEMTLSSGSTFSATFTIEGDVDDTLFYKYRVLGPEEYYNGGWETGEDRKLPLLGDGVSLDTGVEDFRLTREFHINVNLHHVPYFDPSIDEVHVLGDFNSYTESSESRMFQDENDDFNYRFTISDDRLEADSLFYIYKIVAGDARDLPADGFEVGGDRFVIAGPLAEHNFINDLFREYRPDRVVTFSVDMSVQIAKGAFDPDFDAVFVTGSFDGWAKTDPGSMLTDDDADQIYSTDMVIEGYEGDNVFYKFFSNTPLIGWEWGNDSELILTPDKVDIILDPRLFGLDDDTRPLEFRDVSFTVDMGSAPDFDPSLDDVYVVGSLNAWDLWDEWKMTQDSDNPYIYTITHSVKGFDGDPTEYKYRIVAGDDRPLPNDGFEILDRELFKNRVFNVSAPGVPMAFNDFYRYEEFAYGVVKPQIGIASPGDVVSVLINVGQKDYEPFLYGIGFEFLFDESIFEYERGFYFDDLTPFETSIVFSNRDHLDEGRLGLSLTSTSGEGTDAGGVVRLFRLEFRVKDGAPYGEVGFGLRNLMAVNSWGDRVPISFEFEPLNITEAQFTEVWPGDTDNNSFVDVNDILPVGQYYNEIGFARNYDGSFFFEAQSARVWEIPSSTYADATGDGYINQNDILPLGINFGKSSTSEKIADLGRKIAEFEQIDLEIPALSKGDLIRVSVNVGSSDEPIVDLLGVAMRAIVPKEIFNLAEQSSGEFLGNSEDLLTFNHFDNNTNILSVAATRTAPQGVISGHGTLYQIELEIVEDMSQSASISLIEAATSSPTTINKSPSISIDYDVITSADFSGNMAPTTFELQQNYPNPFNPTTNIAFAVPEQSLVKIEVYNTLGQMVKTLTNKVYTPGTHAVEFSSDNLTSGLYIYRMSAGSTVITKKMMLIK